METVKKELRAECRKRSAALSREYRESAGAAIRERVLSSPEYRQAGTIFIYVSMETEPDTLEMWICFSSRGCLRMSRAPVLNSGSSSRKRIP